jgi:hypothetical protein
VCCGVEGRGVSDNMTSNVHVCAVCEMEKVNLVWNVGVREMECKCEGGKVMVRECVRVCARENEIERERERERVCVSG